VAYEQLSNQLLNTTSTGNVYLKGTGFTTGHSSTSPDNSLALAILYLMAWKSLTGLGAREFKHFNILSDYADDHVLSMLATKPAAWNFTNIQRVMKSWGVENRLEAAGDLSSIPFLSKFSRKVNPADVALFKRMQIPIPKRVVYHDRDKLLGKMVANVKSKEPKYRVKRLLSYMSLTPHHHDIYLGIRRILTRSSTAKRALKTMKAEIPTYQKVLADWYHPSEHSVRDVIDEQTGELEKSGLAYSYGHLTLWDSCAGMLAMVPDVLNPTIFNFGYQRAFQLQARELLKWPVEFLVHQNNLISPAELAGAFRSSCYHALDVTIAELTTPSSNPVGHLPKHWAFVYYTKRWKPRFGSVMTSIANSINKVQFIINGRLNPSVSEFRLLFLDLVVMAVLSFVPSMPFLALVGSIQLPRVDILFEMAWGCAWAFLWSSVPSSYKEVTHLVRSLHSVIGGILISAPTGTGKSTALIKHLTVVTGHMYHKIIVIVPRSVLVKSLVTFTRDAFGLDSTGFTSGVFADKACKVWYMTPQEALLHFNLVFDPKNLIIVDEAHLEEEFYHLVLGVLDSMGGHYLMCTATPTPQLNARAALVVPLSTPSLWTIGMNVTQNEQVDPWAFLKDYEKFVSSTIPTLWHRSKILVFHPSISGAHRLADRINKKCSFLNSEENDTSGQVIFCTSVADAGLTVPSVDHVISSNVDFAMSGKLNKVILTIVADMTVTQRKGRTGRSNNGTFHFFKGVKLQCPSMSSIRSEPETMLMGWLSAGMLPSMLVKHEESIVKQGMMQFEGFGQMDERTKLDTIKLMSIYIHNLTYFRQSRVLEGVNEPGEDEVIPTPLDYTAAGNFSESSLWSIESITNLAANLAVQAGLANSGLDYDIASACDTLGKLSKVPALMAPFHHLFPIIEDPIGDLKDEYNPDEVKHLGASALARLKTEIEK
jgi:hypothetical protein